MSSTTRTTPRKETVTKEKFDYKQHYLEIYEKFRKLLKDFDIKEYIDFKNSTGLNNCQECHVQISEPSSHEHAKKKLFKLFVNEKNYLVESELKANKQLFVPGKGIKDYQFDNFIINVPNFIKFMAYMNDIKYLGFTPDIEMLKELEKGLVFALEADGGGHSEKKDKIRDNFFFTNYNIITIRFKIDQLVVMEESNKKKKLRLKYNAYKQFAELPLFHNITSEQIVAEAKILYRAKYNHF